MIGIVHKKVRRWRELYRGTFDASGKRIQINLQQAARMVGISKKSLDDYLLQIKFFLFRLYLIEN